MSHESVAATGAIVTTTTGLVGWAVEAIPVLQALSFIVSILVGVATVAWITVQVVHLKKKK